MLFSTNRKRLDFVRRTPAFTLIELLMVVAIIAILATIATVNFLESQTRAKVSRVKADMRSLATAIESYRVDENKYPSYLNAHDKGYPYYPRDMPGSLNDRCYDFCIPIRLTTPVAYITSLRDDLFSNNHSEAAAENQPHPFHYGNDEDYSSNPAEREPGPERFPVRFLYTVVHRGFAIDYSPYPIAPHHAYAHLLDYINDSVVWSLVSHGPDLDYDEISNVHLGELPGYDGVPCQYDPTNGSVSGGDLYYWGPALGPD